MAKLPKKPKFLKHPKKPKKGSTLQRVNAWENRCKEIDRKNQEKANVYNKKITAIKTAKTKLEKIHGMGSVPRKTPKLKTLY
jgi:hypothetical protein